MEKLKKDFIFKGFNYHQEWRNKNFAIYSQWLGDELVGYESIKIKQQKEKLAFGRKFQAKELYPNDTDWGKYGFTSKTFVEAQEMLYKHFKVDSNLPNLGLPTFTEALSFQKDMGVRVI